MVHECQKHEIIKDIKKDIDNLYAMKDIVIELKTLVTMQIEQNNKQDKIIAQQSETLIKISEIVTQQGSFIKTLCDDYDELSKSINDKNMEDIKSNSISFSFIFNKIITEYLPPVILMGLLYLIIQNT